MPLTNDWEVAAVSKLLVAPPHHGTVFAHAPFSDIIRTTRRAASSHLGTYGEMFPLKTANTALVFTKKNISFYFQDLIVCKTWKIWHSVRLQIDLSSV